MRNKTTISLGITTIIIALIIVGVTTYPMTGAKASREEYIIGGTFPLSGSLAMYGNAYANGMRLAVDEINAQGRINGKILKLDVADNKGDAKTAVSDVTFFSQDSVAVFQSIEYLTQATMSITEKTKTPMISFTTYRLTAQDDANYTFIDSWNMHDVGADFGHIATTIGSERAGIIGMQDASFEEFKRGISSEYKGEIIATETFQFGDDDFKTQLLKLEQANVDTIIIYAYPVEAGRLLKQMEELGVNKHIIMTEGTEEFVMDKHEEFLQKTHTISYLGSTLDPTEKGFITKYSAIYNATPRPDSFYAYENVKRIAAALEVCDENKDCITKEIAKNFDKLHNNARELPLVQYDDGWTIMQE